MSDQFNYDKSPVNQEIVLKIDQLNLPTIQKHYIRLLFHCLEIFKEILHQSKDLTISDNEIEEWCKKQSKKINDDSFSDNLYAQMLSAKNKLSSFSEQTGKILQELNLDDLIALTEKNFKELD